MRLRNSAETGKIARPPWICAVVFMLLSAVVLPIGSPHSTSASSPSAFFVEATGHSLADPFLSYWIDNNGREALGFPISDIVDRGAHSAQYFQYGAVVQRSSGSVTRIRVGLELLDEHHHPDSVTTHQRRTGSAPTRTGFIPVIQPLQASVGTVAPLFHVDPAFEEYYQQHSGPSLLGQPLSNAYTYSGKTSQWFEFGRLELVNDRVTQAEVGFELAQALAIDTAPSNNSGWPIFDPDRYRSFAGDGTIPSANGTFTPTRIWIPAIEVNAVIEPVNIINRVMGVPENAWSVGWYPSISSPGEWTNVVMAGHRDWWGLGPVVFWNLSKLTEGNKIYVMGEDGSGFTYLVTRSWIVDATIDANSLIEDTGTESLTLITCDGQFNGSEYTSRRIVRAERI